MISIVRFKMSKGKLEMKQENSCSKWTVILFPTFPSKNSEGQRRINIYEKHGAKSQEENKKQKLSFDVLTLYRKKQMQVYTILCFCV